MRCILIGADPTRISLIGGLPRFTLIGADDTRLEMVRANDARQSVRGADDTRLSLIGESC